MTTKVKQGIIAAIALPAWVFLAFIGTQLLVGVLLGIAQAFGAVIDLESPLFQTSFAAIIYAITLLVVIGLPWLILKKRTTRKELSLTRSLNWKDVGIATLGFVAYLILTAILLTLATNFLPFIDLEQAQDVGFQQIGQRYELLLAFLALVIFAPIAEEVLFRGYLFGKLRQKVPLWVAILITSVLFGAVHGQFNVGLDTFALSVAMCLAVVWAKSLWPAILIHMLKNGIAFYFLFINPII